MTFDLARIFGLFVCFLGALCVHEWAHAYVAYRYGDHTAKRQGRLTLNPQSHIDPIGTILLPIFGAITHFPLLGWAKPVPVNPNNFNTEKKTAMMMVAFAGPLSNLILCVVTIFALVVLDLWTPLTQNKTGFFYPLIDLAKNFAFVNAILAFFNLIPLPPLDGASVFGGFLPNRWLEAYEQAIAPFGIWILLLLLWTGVLVWVNKAALLWVDLQFYGFYYTLNMAF